MKLFKTEFTRFFALGFAGGAALVLLMMGPHAADNLADNIVPPAQAAETR